MSNPIGWCDTTWSPVTGCTPISPGCANCWARRMAQRLRGRYGYPADDPFRVTIHPERLEEPRHWSKPRHVFVCSMADLFHDEVPEEFIARVFSEALMCAAAVLASALEPRHTFMFLTKRPQRMASLLAKWREQPPRVWPGLDQSAFFRRLPPNVWLGVTAEDQQRADERIPVLLSIPAAKHFVSIEPMLSAVDLESIPQLHNGVRETVLAPECWGECSCGDDPGCRRNGGDGTLRGVDWVICGGETGPRARPMHPNWVRSLRDQCVQARVAFWFKQWGSYVPGGCAVRETPWAGTGYDWRLKGGGRLLDGREWSERP